ncbi:MAG: helix-turn-helix domain-containing protein [Gammaproteobacteria bacterium]|nr:helix-turn-helix domain-containing protein [Gammaproteobacteria bacterium]
MEGPSTTFFNDLLTIDELLALLKNQYSKDTVYRWIQKEEMPYLKIKGRLWFSRKTICSWIKGVCL